MQFDKEHVCSLIRNMRALKVSGDKQGMDKAAVVVKEMSCVKK